MSAELTTPRGPEANLGYLFRLAHQRFRAALEDVLEDLGLTAQQYAILSVFETRRELSCSELARITQVTRQTMHSAVLELEAAELVERRPKNQRVVMVRATERGLRTLQAASERVHAIEQAALGDLGRGDERAVRQWLANVAALPTNAGSTSAGPTSAPQTDIERDEKAGS